MTEHDDVRELLRAGVATLEPSPDLRERAVTRGRTIRRRRRGAAAATALAAVVAVALVAPGVWSTVRGERTLGFADSTDVLPPAVPGTWTGPFTAPIDGRINHTATWADGRLVLWGGEVVGETGSLGSGVVWDDAGWREMARSPLSARGGHGAVWTGERVLVVGGVAASEAGEVHTVGEEPPGRPMELAAYDPTTDRWERLPDAPVETRRDAVVLWTGDRLVVWGGASEQHADLHDGAVYEPAAGTWQVIPAAPISGLLGRPTGVWTGSELLVWRALDPGRAPDVDGAPLEGAGFDPATARWRRLARVGADLVTGDVPHATRLDDGRVALLTSHGGVLYDPAGDAYAPMATPPWTQRAGPEPVWTGTHLLTWGGVDGVRRANDGFAYDPATDTWSRLPAAPLPGRAQHTLTWTGEALVVWGGVDARYRNDRQGAVLHPSDTGHELVAVEPPAGGRPLGHAFAEDGALRAVGIGGAAVDLYRPEDGSAVVEAAAAPDARLVAWRAVVVLGDGTFRLVSGGEGRPGEQPLEVDVDSPAVGPRPVWLDPSTLAWIEMPDEASARIRLAQLDGAALATVLDEPLDLPDSEVEPFLVDEVPDWDGVLRYALDGVAAQTDLAGGGADVLLQVAEQLSPTVSNATLGIVLRRDGGGRYALEEGLVRLDG
jgi:N-acetylneuraminic acid mutarotase